MHVTALIGRREATAPLMYETINLYIERGLRVTVIALDRAGDFRKNLRAKRGQIDYFEILGKVNYGMISRFLNRVNTLPTIVDCSGVPEGIDHDTQERLNLSKRDLFVIRGMDRADDWPRLLQLIEEDAKGKDFKLLVDFPEPGELDEEGVADPESSDPLELLPFDVNTTVIRVVSPPKLPLGDSTHGNYRGGENTSNPNDLSPLLDDDEEDDGEEWKRGLG